MVMLVTYYISTEHRSFNCIYQMAPIYTQLNTWFLGTTRVCLPNVISIGLSVFARLMIMTKHAQTDCATAAHIRHCL